MTTLLSEVESDYSYTMNGIIFDKYLQECSTDLVPHSLVLPPKTDKFEVPYQGRLELAAKQGAKEVQVMNPQDIFKYEPKDYMEIFK